MLWFLNCFMLVLVIVCTTHLFRSRDELKALFYCFVWLRRAGSALGCEWLIELGLRCIWVDLSLVLDLSTKVLTFTIQRKDMPKTIPRTKLNCDMDLILTVNCNHFYKDFDRDSAELLKIHISTGIALWIWMDMGFYICTEKKCITELNSFLLPTPFWTRIESLCRLEDVVGLGFPLIYDSFHLFI